MSSAKKKIPRNNYGLASFSARYVVFRSYITILGISHEPQVVLYNNRDRLPGFDIEMGAAKLLLTSQRELDHFFRSKENFLESFQLLGVSSQIHDDATFFPLFSFFFDFVRPTGSTTHPEVHSTPSPDMAGNFFSAKTQFCNFPLHSSSLFFMKSCFPVSLSASLTHIHNKQTFTLALPSFLLP